MHITYFTVCHRMNNELTCLIFNGGSVKKLFMAKLIELRVDLFNFTRVTLTYPTYSSFH